MNIVVKKILIERVTRILLPVSILMFAVSLTACHPLGGNISRQQDKPETQRDLASRSDIEATIETDARNIFRADDLNDIIGFIGKPAKEIILESVSSYYCFTDGSEVFLAEDGQIYLRFSDEVWKDDSECVAVGLPSHWLTVPDDTKTAPTMSDVKTDLGVEFEYCREGAETYYSYSFADLEMKVYVAEDGTTLYNQGDTEKYALIQLRGAWSKTDIPNKAKLESLVNLKDARSRPEWETVNRYISHIGKTLEETEMLSGYALEAIGDAGDYEDTETEARYFFDPDQGGLCTSIYIPTPVILPLQNGIMTKAELLDYWKGVSFGWSYYEGSSYTFLFEDAAVIINLFEENWGAVWDITKGSAIVIRI